VSRRPLVSVVVPTLDAARYVGEALDCIAAQTYDAWEVVLVDGGSTDATLEVALGYPRVRALRQRGSGLAGAWNEGIEAARGDLIAFLDSDDLWEPRKLALQVAALEADEDVDCVISLARFVLEPGFPVPPGFRPELLDAVRPAQLPSALLARRSVFERIGVFETGWAIAADVDWFARLKDARLRMEVVPELLVHKRMHDANLSTLGGPTVNRELLEVLRASVQRQRGTS
jgi:glycosyltransferase involved in cell wall biosynthesis